MNLSKRGEIILCLERHTTLNPPNVGRFPRVWSVCGHESLQTWGDFLATSFAYCVKSDAIVKNRTRSTKYGRVGKIYGRFLVFWTQNKNRACVRLVHTQGAVFVI